MRLGLIQMVYNTGGGGGGLALNFVMLEHRLHQQFLPKIHRSIMKQGFIQGPVRPSFDRPIFSLDVEKYRQTPPNYIVGGPQTPSSPNNK